MVMAFFGFFRSGEITVPSITGFDPTRHLKWGDVCANRTESPSLVRVHLSFSKCDQLGKGVDVFLGATGDELCPVRAITSYSQRRGWSSTGEDHFYRVCPSESVGGWP